MRAELNIIKALNTANSYQSLAKDVVAGSNPAPRKARKSRVAQR